MRPTLPSGDLLEPADYQRLCAVLDDVLGAQNVKELRERLEAALVRHFGWTEADARTTHPVTFSVGGQFVMVVPPDVDAPAKQRAILDRLSRYLLPPGHDRHLSPPRQVRFGR